MAGEITENDAIYQLLISADNPEVQAAIKQLVDSGMSLKEALDQVNASASKTSDLFNNLTSASKEGIDKSAGSVRDLTEQLSAATNQANALKEAMAAPATLPEQSFINQLPYSQFQLEAAGAAPGAGGVSQADFVASLKQSFRPTFPEPPLMEGEGVSSGSLFGVGHALSIAGFMTGAPGLREAGALVYIEEGLKRVTPLFDQLNQSITNTPTVLSPLIGGLTQLGVPMAGLLGVAVPLAAAVALAAVAITSYNDAIEESRSALQGILNTQDAYYGFIQTATTKEAQDKVQSLEDTNATAKKKLDENVGIVKSYFDGIGIKVLGDVDGVFSSQKYLENLKKSVSLVGYDSTIMDAIDKATKYGQTIADNTVLINRLTGDLGDNTFAANDAVAAQKLQTEAGIAAADNNAAYQKQLASDMAMSSKQGQERLAMLQQEGPLIQDHMNALKPYIDTNEQAKKEYEQLNFQLGNTVGEIGFLTNTAIPAAQALEAQVQAEKDLEKATKDALKAHDDYVKSVQTAQDQITNQAINARAREYQNEQQYWAGSIQDAYQRDKIITDESRKETQLTQDTANSIVDIRTKLSQKESDAMTDYNRKVMDDQTKYLENKQGAELDTYRKERDNLQSHYDKLADIQNKEAVNQQDALLNRNFLQLAQQKDNRQKEIDAENLSYDRRQRDAQTHLQDQEYDLKVHLAEERTQQFVEYRRKLVDDRQQTQREIDQRQVDEQRKRQVLQQSEVQQLNDLSTAETYKLQLLRQGLSQELQMYELQNQQRLAILDRDYRAAQSQALSTIQSSAAAAGTPLTASGNIALAHKLGLMDSGGPFEAGVPFMKGDISELFNFGGGKSYAIPGAAVVMPLQAGTATPQGGNQFNFHIPIANNNMRDAALEAGQQVTKKIMEALGEA